MQTIIPTLSLLTTESGAGYGNDMANVDCNYNVLEPGTLSCIVNNKHYMHTMKKCINKHKITDYNLH